MAAGRPAEKVFIPSDFLGDFDAGLKGSLLGDKAISSIFDNSKIKRFVPGFKATIRFKEGIKSTVKWFEENPKRMIMDPENNKFMDKIIQSYNRS